MIPRKKRYDLKEYENTFYEVAKKKNKKNDVT